ncbi:MAG: dienelactone hydrolase family protein [Acidimicrobiales bacterium]
MAYQDYLATEIALDHADGVLTRREALRRLGLMGLGAAASVNLLAACGGDGDDTVPAGTSAATGDTTAATDTADTAAAPSSSAATATTDGSATTDAPAAPNSATGAQGLAPARITFPGPAGELIGWLATAEQPKGAVLLIHENRGLTQHFKDLPGRFAAAGYTALSIDLLSRQGGTEAIGDEGAVTAALGQAAQADLTADAKAGLDELGKRATGHTLAAVGFCFGGGQVWSLLAAGEPRLHAAAPFYGPGPQGADFSGSPNAAVLGVYAENDSRVNASRDAMGAALTAAGLTHELRTFPGVDHAFFNDTGARYNAEQAAAAFEAVLSWFGTHLS